MQNRKIVSAMMGAALSMVNISSAIAPVYAKPNFIFPSVSMSTQEVKEETMDIEVETTDVFISDNNQEELDVKREKFEMYKNANESSSKNSKNFISESEKEKLLLLAEKIEARKKEKERELNDEGLESLKEKENVDNPAELEAIVQEETKFFIEESMVKDEAKENVVEEAKNSETTEVLEPESAIEVESEEPIIEEIEKELDESTVKNEKKVVADEKEMVGDDELNNQETIQPNEVTITEQEVESLAQEEVAPETIPEEDIEEDERIELELNYNICQIQHVNIDDCPLYDYPDEKLGLVLEYLPNKERVFVIGDSINDFYAISYNDEEYYVKKENVMRILSEDFEFVDVRTVYLNQNVDILNLPENQSTTFMAEDLATNTKLLVTGEHELGYLKVLLGEDVGYIPEEYCSDTKLLPKTSEIQMKIAENAANPETAPCESGYCAAWITRIYRSVGLYKDETWCNAIDYWHNWGINDGVTSSTRYDNIPVGAVVVGSGGGGELGNTYGHVGIYLGDGLVAENVGKHNVVTLEKWMEYNRGNCDGYQGYIGWVFPFNVDLQDY